MGVLSDKILAPSDTNGGANPASLHTKDGVVVDSIASSATTPITGSIPVCLVGDVLPNGRWAVPARDSGTFDVGCIAFFDSDITLITTVTGLWPGVTGGSKSAYLRSDHDASFWVVAYDSGGGGETGSLHQFDADGNSLFSRADVFDSSRGDWPTNNPSDHTLNGIAVKYDGSLLYLLNGTFNPARVYVYDIVNDLWSASELITLTGYRSDIIDGLILVHGGDTLAVSHRAPFGSGAMHRYISLYTIAGALLATKDFGALTTDSNEMGVDPSDDTALYVKVIQGSGGSETYTMYKLSSTDLSEMQTPATGPTVNAGGVVPESCPVLVFPVGDDEGGGGDDDDVEFSTESIRWLRRVPHQRAS